MASPMPSEVGRGPRQPAASAAGRQAEEPREIGQGFFPLPLIHPQGLRNPSPSPPRAPPPQGPGRLSPAFSPPPSCPAPAGGSEVLGPSPDLLCPHQALWSPAICMFKIPRVSLLHPEVPSLLVVLLQVCEHPASASSRQGGWAASRFAPCGYLQAVPRSCAPQGTWTPDLKHISPPL